ncbi:MAG TPA: hypothetical protein VLB74_04935 [Flavobacterium sp.]|uniref:hypothetical protein n=1 Tax=Flavobacterium sp. TaxID=239 RepID=UPI002CC0CCBB|nr:hypothetical protein [Flavobacterium sp.]HSD13972.1 hypothetical protein [Flavobacterium sp.]
MKSIVKIYIIVFTFLGLNYSLGQIKLDSTKIAQISINHQYHCNPSKKKFFTTKFVLDELTLRIANLEYIEKNDELILTGKITNNYGDAIPCDIQIANISKRKCKYERLIGTADKNGNFNIVLKKDDKKSIYFTFISHYDLEIKIKSIYSR